jgi:hypothetical protein
MAEHKIHEHHEQAAQHYEHAAKHHREAAKHHKAGNHEKAAHHARIAFGHYLEAARAPEQCSEATRETAQLKAPRCRCCARPPCRFNHAARLTYARGIRSNRRRTVPSTVKATTARAFADRQDDSRVRIDVGPACSPERAAWPPVCVRAIACSLQDECHPTGPRTFFCWVAYALWLRSLYRGSFAAQFALE